jgi:nickel-dependent lactate racemase
VEQRWVPNAAAKGSVTWARIGKMLKYIRLEYGKESCEFSVPADRYAGTLMPRSAEPVPDLGETLSHSFAHPVDDIPLKEKLKGARSMLILTVDITRPSPTPLMLPILRLCKGRGIAVTICICLGRHGKMTEDALHDFLTPEVFDNYSVVQHDAFDDSIHIDFGCTTRGTPIKLNKIIQQHDFLCGISFIEPSYLMGFSGSRKLIIPGIAHYTSIDANHYWLTDPATRIGELNRNPMHQDAMEFMKHFHFDWLTCAVLDGRDRITQIFSGDSVKAHGLACKASGEIFRIRKKAADIVISSPGGYPYDLDLVQGKKGVIPAIECVKPGGSIIILAACPDGWGAEGTFKEWLLTKRPEEVIRDAKKRDMFSLGAHGAYILARPIVEKRANMIIVTNQDLASQLQDSYIHAVTTIEEAMELARKLCSAPEPTYLALKNARRLILDAFSA